MSLGAISSKYTVCDIYPIRYKKFLVLVDPQNISGDTSDFHATLSTIQYLLSKEASVVVASSFGPLSGCSLNLPRDHREAALEAFSREQGYGFTNFFATLPSMTKMEVLKAVPGFTATSNSSEAGPVSGKTTLFAKLNNHQKRKALGTVFPKKEFAQMSTLPFVDALKDYFPGVPVSFAPDCLRAPLHTLNRGEIMVLENLRFYRNEASGDERERGAMAEVLAAGIDIFINDSFATAYCRNASNVGLPKYLLHGAAGHSMDRELAFYSKFLTHPARPLALLVAGRNIPGKLKLIHSLIRKVDRILVGGAIAYPFLAAKGLSCGMQYALDDEPVVTTESRESPEREITCSEYAKEILRLCALHKVELVLPIDHVLTTDPDADQSTAVLVESTAIPEKLYSMDCGVHTINLFTRYLRDCRTVFWTGPLGWISKGYSAATNAFATALAEADIISIIAGRRTGEVVQELGFAGNVLHISSGGLSGLDVLQGNLLPGVEALSDISPPADSNTSLSVNELLRNLPIFIGCNSHQMNQITKKFVRRVHGQGDYLVCYGDAHIRLCVVAQGGLVARYGAETGAAPARYIPCGQSVGMYEFITQAPAAETVRAARSDTVTYQLSHSALNELLVARPDLAQQLFRNLAEPLRVLSIKEYQKQQGVWPIVWRNACRTRVPQPLSVPRGPSLWKDIIQDVISTIAFQRLTMQYTPYAVDTGATLAENLPYPRVVLKVLEKMKQHRGISVALLVCTVRNVAYHNSLNMLGSPWEAGLVSSVVVAPLRLLAYGVAPASINPSMLLHEALYSAVASAAPLVSYALFLAAVRRVQRMRGGRVSHTAELFVMAAVKACLGVALFPIIYQRQFVPQVASQRRVWNASAFKSYEAKQAASVALRAVTNVVLKFCSDS